MHEAIYHLPLIDTQDAAWCKTVINLARMETAMGSGAECVCGEGEGEKPVDDLITAYSRKECADPKTNKTSSLNIAF